jgi:hypothetical protein
VAVLLLAGFAWWELRSVRQGRQTLLNPRLLRISGFAAGLGIGLVYSAVLLASGSCSRCSSRTGWATRRCAPVWP